MTRDADGRVIAMGGAMSERESNVRKAVIVYFPMFIAALSLVTSMYNGYLNNKFVDFIQRNFSRAESLRTCKEILEAHAQVQFRAKVLSQTGERARKGETADLTAAAAGYVGYVFHKAFALRANPSVDEVERTKG